MKDSITLKTGDGDTIRMDADTAAFLLSAEHLHHTLHRMFDAEDRLAAQREEEDRHTQGEEGSPILHLPLVPFTAASAAWMPVIDKHRCFGREVGVPNFLTLPSGRRIELPTFRSNVPVYAAPDRKTWQAKHGAAPYPVADVRANYFTKAQRAYETDYSSMNYDDAIDAQTKLEMVNLSVHAQSTAADADLCFFDPTDGQFWIYPLAKP